MSKEKENLRESIKPEDIVFDDKKTETPDDSQMPRPQTKLYNQYLKVTPYFMELFHKSVDTLPYKSVLETVIEGKTQRIRLIDLVRFVEQNMNRFTIKDMNTVISYISDIDFAHARPFMEVVERKEAQPQLWSAFEE